MVLPLRRSTWASLTGALVGILLLLAAFTFTDYGVTVDEEHGAANGEYFLNWYASGFSDNTINTEGNHYLYGSLVNALSTVAVRFSPFGAYETRHLFIALVGIAGIFFAWRIGKLLGGPLAGFLSASILALTPTYYGHMFMNPKDIPFAVLFLATIYYLLAAYDRLPRLPARTATGLGVAIGLALGIRIGALMLFGYCAVLVVIWLAARFRSDDNYRARDTIRDLRPAAVSLMIVGVVAWALMLVWWPYAQLSPLLNPLRAFRRAANFTDFPATVLFDGRFFPADALPLSYLPVSLLVALPEFYAVALVAGVIAFVLRRRRGSRPVSEGGDTPPPNRYAKMAFLIFAILFPLGAALVLRPILYDANRHFLFVIPPLAVLAGVALASLLQSSVPRAVRIAVSAGMAVLSIVVITDMIRLHPYQYVYYNRTSGGLPGAFGRYETDYWGQSHKEGIDWLISNYRVGAPAGSIRVANTAADFQTAYYLSAGSPRTARFTPVSKRQGPDVVLSITRWNAHLKWPGRVLHVVRRFGVPLLYVVEVRAPPAA